MYTRVTYVTMIPIWDFRFGEVEQVCVCVCDDATLFVLMAFWASHYSTMLTEVSIITCHSSDERMRVLLHVYQLRKKKEGGSSQSGNALY